MDLTAASRRRLKKMCLIGFPFGAWAQFYPTSPHSLSVAEVAMLAAGSAAVVGVTVTGVAWIAARLRRMEEAQPQGRFAAWFGLLIGLVLGSAVTNLILNSLEVGGRQ